MNEQEFRELSAAHALRTLLPDEEEAFSAALTAHPEWRSITDTDLETAAELGSSVDAVEPPPAARASILDAIADMPQSLTASPANSGATVSQPSGNVPPPSGKVLPTPDHIAEETTTDVRRRSRAGWFALAASVAVLLALSFTPGVRDLLAPQDPVTMALEQVEEAPDASTAATNFDEAGEATLHWSASEKQAVFIAEGLPTLDTAHDYELWIVRGEQPISLGVVEVGADGETAIIADGFEVGDALAVTVEDLGGSPNGAPTTDPILVVASA